ncbi:MAG: hypothetical protein ACREOO_17385 [bacterium]
MLNFQNVFCGLGRGEYFQFLKNIVTQILYPKDNFERKRKISAQSPRIHCVRHKVCAQKQIPSYLRLADNRPGVLIDFGERQLKAGIARIANDLLSLGIYHAEHRKELQRQALLKPEVFVQRRTFWVPLLAEVRLETWQNKVR